MYGGIARLFAGYGSAPTTQVMSNANTTPLRPNDYLQNLLDRDPSLSSANRQLSYEEAMNRTGAATPMEFSSPFFAWGWAAKGLGHAWNSVFGEATTVAAKTGGVSTWNGFQKMTAGQFASRSETALAWNSYKSANGIVTGTSRNMAQRSAFLKSAAISEKYPSWMKPWLSKGKVPPGYHVDHYKALFDGGLDIPSNMRLKDIMTHINRHRYYRP